MNKGILLDRYSARQSVCGLWDYISPTRLNLWLKCPLAFRFRYVDGIQTPTSPSLLVGKVVHGALEYSYRHRQQGCTRSTSEVIRHLDQLWAQGVADEPVSFDSADHQDALCGQATELVIAYLAHHFPDESAPIAVEETMEAPLIDPRSGEHLGVPLVGIVDLVLPGDTGSVIVDFKTTARAAAPAEIQHEIQLSSYAYLFRDAFQDKEGTLEIRSLVKTKEPQVHVHPYPPRSEAHFGRLFAAIQGYLDDLDTRRFVFRPGLGCSFCDYRRTYCCQWRG